jgi:PAS domain S-box-containing protein
MKRKIIIIFAAFCLITLLSSVFIVTSIDQTIAELHKLITLHQVELFREHLVMKIRRVQGDLKLKGTRYARSVDTMVVDTVAMSEKLDDCFRCHHSKTAMGQLVDLRHAIHLYQDHLSRVITVRANAARLEEEEESAFRIGEELTEKVNAIISATEVKLQQMTTLALVKIRRTKLFLYVISALVPFLAVGLGYVVVKGVTNPLQAILQATRKLKEGNLSYRIRALKDEFGEVAESFNDMTSTLMESREHLKQSEMRYRTLFERAGDAIFILSTEESSRLRIVDANQAAADMHGYTLDELRSMKITDFGQPETPDQVSGMLDRIMRGEWVKTETVHRRKNGTTFMAEVSAGPITIGDQTFILNIDSDITERKNAEKARSKAEQFKVGGILAAGLSHELKNSLGGIKIAVEVLLEEASLSSEDRKVLEDVMKEVRRIEVITRGLLDFTRPSVPQFSLINLNVILERTLDDISADMNGRKNTAGAIMIMRDLDDHLPKIMADPAQVRQVFKILLDNAVEAMGNGGLITARTVYRPESNSADVYIADTGPGISEEAKKMIFDPFYTTKPKGDGMGLSIARRLIEQHGGTIEVQDDEGTGAVFRLTLPVGQPEKIREI